ncbi:MAG TPA: GNAT family N-acetyltransferase [Bryobacteraceae bacterium]|nr:GNAT family N-acetyltransferase [Bryobacteraceae bacterium]
MSNRIRRLESADIPQALAMSSAAGWNQTEYDWRLVLEMGPDGCFAMECEGVVVATATSIAYGDDLAWIGMVLTHPEYRRRGFARAVMKRVLEYLEGLGSRTVKLDATKLGAPLYRELGFVDECAIERWARPRRASPTSSTMDDFALPAALDAEAFGADRSGLLQRLAVLESASNGKAGFAMGRPGANAAYFGPCVSRSHDTARALAEWFLARHPDEWVFWDILPENGAAANVARELGFTAARRLTRMLRGAQIRQNTSLVYAGAGFEFG